MKKEIHKTEKILEKCKNKNILHIGATASPYHKIRAKKKKLLHQKIDCVCKKQIGLDFDKKAIKSLKKYNLKNIFYGDIVIDKYDSKIKNNEYDIIIFGDVIEHLSNPGLALNNLKKFMNKNTILILTTPNVWSIYNLRNIFLKKEIVHPDHTFWPSKKTMDKMITKANFKIINFKYLFSGSKKDKVSLIFKILRKSIPVKNRSVLYYEIKLKE